MSYDRPDSKAESLYDHLAELRKRLINCCLILMVATGICYGFSEYLFNFVREPIAHFLPDGGLIYTGPMDKFIAHLKLAFLSGVITSCPFWLYQIWKFIAPGLYSNERKYSAVFIIAGSILFLLGTMFSYFIALPMAFEFLMGFGGDIDKPMISIDQYMSFFTQMSLMFGLSFELPLIIVVLGVMGIISQAFLRKNRKYAIMVLAIGAAIITPPDVLSMLMMLGPLWVLFEIAIFIVGFFEKKRAAVVVNELE